MAATGWLIGNGFQDYKHADNRRNDASVVVCCVHFQSPRLVSMSAYLEAWLFHFYFLFPISISDFWLVFQCLNFVLGQRPPSKLVDQLPAQLGDHGQPWQEKQMDSWLENLPRSLPGNWLEASLGNPPLWPGPSDRISLAPGLSCQAGSLAEIRPLFGR